MSRGGAKAAQEHRRRERELDKIEAWFKRLEEWAALDVVLAACDRCGLEQVTPPTGPSIDDYAPAGTACVVCGCETARFVRNV